VRRLKAILHLLDDLIDAKALVPPGTNVISAMVFRSTRRRPTPVVLQPLGESKSHS